MVFQISRKDKAEDLQQWIHSVRSKTVLVFMGGDKVIVGATTYNIKDCYNNNKKNLDPLQLDTLVTAQDSL